MSNIIKQLQDGDGNNIYPLAYNMGGAKMDLLWTNPSPTSSFTAQTISLDLSNYDLVLIFARRDASNYNYNINTLVNRDGMVNMIGTYSSKLCTRGVTMTDSGLEFGAGFYATGYGTDTNDNNKNIPYKIYGIKFSYIVPTTVQGLQYVEV